jgi:hypothetical protein
MRVLVAVAMLAGSASASPQPWSVDVAYRGTASLTVAGDDGVPSAYTSSIVMRIDHSHGRWFYGAVLALGVPGLQGQAESSISGGLRQVLRDGVCLRGPSTQLHCGPTLRLDYALDIGVTMATPLGSDEHGSLEYYGPAARPNISFHATWPMRSGKQIGLTGRLGLAAVFGTDIEMKIEDQRSTFRLEPSLELGGTIRF